MVVKMATSNGGSLAAIAGSEAGNGSAPGLDGTDTTGASAGDVGDDIADQSDDDHGADAGSDESDSMDFDDDDEDDDGSDLMSNTTLGDDITAQLAAAGNKTKCALNIKMQIFNLKKCILHRLQDLLAWRQQRQ